MPTILNYNTPTPPGNRVCVRTAAVGGVIAGVLTFVSEFLGPVILMGVGMLAGLILSAFAARASRGYEFRAGFLASAIAAATFWGSAIVYAVLAGWRLSRPDFDLEIVWLAVPVSWAMFALPGVFGSLWHWEARHAPDLDAPRDAGSRCRKFSGREDPASEPL